jgi:hypothetical protein
MLRPSPPLAAALAASLAALAGCGQPEHTSRFDPQTPIELQAKATLRGTIALEAAGTAAPVLADVTISVTGSGAGGATTDADGVWVLGGVAPGTYSVRATRDGYADGFATGVVVTLDDGDQEVEVPPIALEVARGEVTGRVVLDGEASGAGAAVSLAGVPEASSTAEIWTAAATTDAAGLFRLSGVPVGSYLLSATRPGFHAGARGPVAVAAGVATDAGQIQLAAHAGSIAGTVLVEGAADSSGVLVTATGTTLGGTAVQLQQTTLGDGAFLLSGAPAGSYGVAFSKPDYGSQVLAVAVAPGADVVLPGVTLARDTGSVAGVATLAGAADSAGIQVTLTPDPTPADPSPAPAAAAVTDASGTWRADGLPVGHYAIAYAKAPGYAPAAGGVTVVSHSVVTAAPVSLAVIPSQISGRVLLEGRAAPNLNGTTVTIEGTGPSVLTDAAGAYVLSGVPAGARTLLFSRAGHDASRALVSVGPGEAVALFDVTLAVSRGAITGQYALAGAASSGGVVVTASGPATASAVTDASGAFTLAGLPVGTYAVTARRDPEWQPSTTGGVVVTAGGTTPVSASAIGMSPYATASVSGTVRAEGATDHSGTTVSLSGTDFRGQAVTRTAGTAASGAFDIPGLVAGSYLVTLSRPRYDAPAPAGLSVATGQAASLGTATLPISRGTIAGTATLSAGAVSGFPVGTDFSGVVVTLSGVTPTFSAVTDASGSYRFDAVPVSLSGAAYTLTARKASFQARQTTVVAAAGSTVVATALALPVDAGALAGTVLLRDAVGGGGDNATHGGTTVSLTGTAFNGASWSAAAATASTGAFTLGNLPPGSYDVVATSASRTCGAFPPATVAAGATTPAPTVRCLDALAPTAVALGAPQAPAGGQSGYVAGTSVTVPIATAAADGTSPTSNFRGYQIVVGSAADWSAATVVAGQPGSLVFPGLAANAASTLWARAVDWIGNAGPVATAQVVSDSVLPPAPTIATPRTFVDATTTSVTLSGSETDATFAGYEICSYAQAAGSACAAAPPLGCAWSPTAAAFAVSLPANERTCLFARAYDRAGNRSPAASLGTAGVVSDLVAPSPPTLAPSYDPTLLTVRAPWVDLFVTAAATDLPAGGAAWLNVAWLEVNTGSGFEPLCPSSACRPGNVWTPCGCSCADARLICDGTRFVGVRARLLEGTRNVVAVRAVDLAGNVGSGVSQQVEADSTGDVLAATSDIEGTPIVRGRLVGHTDWVQGGSTYGALLDLGPNRRMDATDRRCTVSASAPSGYETPVVPASGTLVVAGDYSAGVRMVRPGADGLFCTADDVNTVFRTPPSGYYVDGVSGFGEKVAWWERKNAPAAASNLYVREPGADGVFGNADDLTASFAYHYVERLTMGEKAILVKEATCGDGCYTFVWRVLNPNAAGSWTSGTTTFDLPAGVQSAALSVDGRRLAWLESGPVLKVREPGANGRFDAGDDVVATIPVPWSLSTGAALTVDGPHVVALAYGSPISWLIHAWAGPDDVFGTSDDAVERTRPTGGSRWELSVAESYLAVSEDNDVVGLDLSALRWEVAPAAGLSVFHPLDVDGRGWVFYKPSGLSPVARSPAGNEVTAPFSSDVYAVAGRELVHVGVVGASEAVQLRAPDAGGSWFSATAPAPVTLFTPGAGSTVDELRLGGGKGLVLDWAYSAARATNVRHYRVLEPGAGTLATFPTTGSVVDVIPDGVRWSWAPSGAITRDQVFYNCHDWATSNVFLCVHNAGADRVFGTADDPRPATYASAVRMLHPAGSPRAGLPVEDARALIVSGRRMLVSEFSPAGIFLFDAGADGLFNTADDRGRRLAGVTAYPSDVALAGDWAAFLDTGSPAGRQIWLVRGFDGAPTPVTSHYSGKTAPTLETSGRLFWGDLVFVPEAVFVRSP